MAMNLLEMLIRRSRQGGESSSSSEEPSIPSDYVLYMPFDEDALDHSTYAREFTLTGSSPSYGTVMGVPCATFPANSYLRSSDLTDISGTSARTLSMWMKLSQLPTANYNFALCIGASGTSGKAISIGVEKSGSNVYYAGGLWGGQSLTVVGDNAANTLWHHLALIYDDGGYSIYLDGSLMASSTGTLTMDGGGIGIGQTSSSFSYPMSVECCYAAVRIYNRAVTASELALLAGEFSPAYVIPTDYVLYAPLVENDASTAVTGQALTYTGTPAETTMYGIPCLDMRNAKIAAPDTGINMGTDPISICIWMYCLETTQWGSAVMMGTNGTNGKKICLLTSMNTTGEIGGDFHNYYYSSLVSSLNKWHCAVITRNGTSSDIYIDGVKKNTYTNSNINTQSSSNLYIGGDNAGSGCKGYLAACRIYNRVLTSEEITSLAVEFTPEYYITANDLSFSLYQKNETYGISYVSPGGTPTFEIIEGTLPSTITFNTSTGKFTGKGLTDDDHVYNLLVRLTAPNSTPATCNVTINTYKTARISVTSKTYNLYTDGSTIVSLTYTSDEDISMAVESGYSLPSGITFFGNSSFRCDGTTAPGTYSVMFRVTSEHNQTGVTTTQTFVVAANAINASDTTLRFYAPLGETSKQIAYTTSKFAITPVYTLTGTLPAGVTFDSSTGTFTSDGTQTADETQTVSLTIASSTGLSTSATITVEMVVAAAIPAIPSDYVFYTPLTADLDDLSQYQRTLTYSGTAPSFTSIEAIGCALVPSGTILMSSDISGITTGNHSRAICFWTKFTSVPTVSSNQNPIAMNVGYAGTSYGNFLIACNSNKYFYSTWNYDVKPNLPLNDDWNCFILSYDSTTGKYEMYQNGVLVASSTDTRQNLPATTRITIAGGYGTYTNPLPVATYFSHVRIYDHALDEDGVVAISSELSPVPQVEFQNQSATFTYASGASTKTLVTNPTGCTFSLTSGTLPSGVTLDTSTGTLSYDGTVVSEDSTTTVAITASKTGYLDNTATVAIKMMVESHTIRFWAGVDTTLYLTNTNGVFVASPSGYGGCGYHSGISGYPEIYFNPKHGLKYSTDGGFTWSDWVFEDTSATLDLSSIGTTITSLTKISGRDTVSLTGQQIMVNDPSSSSGPYVFDVEME